MLPETSAARDKPISRQCAAVGLDGVSAEANGCGGKALMVYVERSQVPNLLDGQVHEQYPGAG
jgi:hypothetical protein